VVRDLGYFAIKDGAKTPAESFGTQLDEGQCLRSFQALPRLRFLRGLSASTTHVAERVKTSHSPTSTERFDRVVLE
jgi:hypothetical protein